MKIDMTEIENYNRNTNNYINTIYDERRPLTEYPFQLTKYLFNRFGMIKSDKLLDVCCGRDDFLLGFKKLGLDVQGVDREKTNSETNSECSELLDKADIKVRQVDLESKSESLSTIFEQNTFDYVFCKSAIEHFHDPGILLKEIYRVLKKDGLLILFTPDWVSNMEIYYDDYTRRTPFTVTSMKDTLEIFGFRDIDTELFYQLPVLWRYPSLKVLSWIIRKIVPISIATKLNKNELEKFIRWNCELQILGYGKK